MKRNKTKLASKLEAAKNVRKQRQTALDEIGYKAYLDSLDQKTNLKSVTSAASFQTPSPVRKKRIVKVSKTPSLETPECMLKRIEERLEGINSINYTQ